jgi:spermidine dehydrogenase
VRLLSTAVEVRNAGPGVDVVYVRGGAAARVRARHAILACYNNIIPFLCPELGETQRAALDYPEKIPLAVVNVALRRWRAIAESGIGKVYTPAGFLNGMGLDFPVSMGGYAYSADPDQPVVLDCLHAAVDGDRELHVFERLKRGRYTMLERPFAEYEEHTRAQLLAAWGDHGFDPDRDIAAITVNRWPHGYAWEYTHLWDEPGWSRGAGPHVIARQQLGRISIANSDAEAFAYVNGAFDAAYRAVREQTTP